jgi:hypothetical protein
VDCGVHDPFFGRFQRREFLGHLTLTGNQNSIGERHDLGQVGRDDYNRLAFVGKSIDELVDLDDRTDVAPYV